MVIFNTAFMFKLFVNVFQSLLNGGSVYLHTILTVLYENIKKNLCNFTREFNFETFRNPIS